MALLFFICAQACMTGGKPGIPHARANPVQPFPGGKPASLKGGDLKHLVLVRETNPGGKDLHHLNPFDLGPL